jgi:Ca2+-binding EF-hand superfamily protein
MLRTSFQVAVLFSLSATLAVQDQKAAKPQARPADQDGVDVGRFFDEFDKNKDGYITRDELPQSLRYCFEKIDTNKDGKISRDELRNGAAHLHPRRRPSDAVFILIEMSDCDECCTEEVQRIYDLLRQTDRNKDGKIDPEELRAMRQQILRERVESIIRDLDKNKDGKISRVEAVGEILRNFDALDLNKDGYVDHDELMQAASAKHPSAPGKLPDTGHLAPK